MLEIALSMHYLGFLTSLISPFFSCFLQSGEIDEKFSLLSLKIGLYISWVVMDGYIQKFMVLISLDLLGIAMLF